VIFGVEDLERCTRFWDDFGLVTVARTADESVFEVASGSKVVVRRKDDRRLPHAYFEGSGVRETIWGVDTPESLEKLVAGLARDREVRRDTDDQVSWDVKLDPDGASLAQFKGPA
jgi:catechol 2,3-dioxygenase-like lactoylglutathione lyase family enzyme